MTTPPRTPQAILASWVSNADSWTEAVRGGHIESRRCGTDVAIVGAMRSLHASQVLDIGCGEGWLSRALDAEGMVVTGFDGSADLIHSARASGGGRFHQCTYDEFVLEPLRFGRFDTAVCNFSLFEHDLHRLLGAIHRLLTPAGNLVIQTLHPRSPANGGCKEGWRLETFGPAGEGLFTPMPWYSRSTATWAKELIQAGFTRVEHTDVEHPHSGESLSLMLRARKGEQAHSADPGSPG